MSRKKSEGGQAKLGMYSWEGNDLSSFLRHQLLIRVAAAEAPELLSDHKANVGRWKPMLFLCTFRVPCQSARSSPLSPLAWNLSSFLSLTTWKTYITHHPSSQSSTNSHLSTTFLGVHCDHRNVGKVCHSSGGLLSHGSSHEVDNSSWNASLQRPVSNDKAFYVSYSTRKCIISYL